MSHHLGLDIGGTNIRLQASDDSGRPIPSNGQLRRPLTESEKATPEGIVAAAAELAQALAASLNCEFQTAGAGCAGLVNEEGVVLTSPNIPCLQNYPLRDALSAVLGCPVKVDNDAATAALAELRHGSLKGVSEGIFVAVGTGIGAAVISGGNLRRGAHNLAGEAGHMTFQAASSEWPQCGCGRRGCWEQAASGLALQRAAQEHERPGSSLAEMAGVSPSDLRGEHVTKLALDNREAARRIIEGFAGAIAMGLNNLITLLDPEVLVLGGGIFADSSGSGYLLGLTKKALADTLSYGGVRPPIELRRAQLGDFAGAAGAALLACDLHSATP